NHGLLPCRIPPDPYSTLTFHFVHPDTLPTAPPPNTNTSASRTFTITVNPINDAPTFTIASDPPIILVGSGAQTVVGFATGISVGPANESSQSLVGFTITQTGSTGGLTFVAAPVINSNT